MSRSRAMRWFPLERTLSVLLAALVVGTLAYVAQVRVPVFVHAPGEVRSQGAVARVAVARAGRVSEVLADSGQRVAQGDVLIQLDHDGGDGERMATLLRSQRDDLAARMDSTTAALAALPERGQDVQAERLSLSALASQTSLALVEVESRMLALDSRRTSQVRAPRSGRLVDLRARVGEQVAAEQLVAAVVDSDPVFHVVARVPAADVARLKVGAPLEVDLPLAANGERMSRTGLISEIAVLPSPARAAGLSAPEFEVKVSLDAAAAGPAPELTLGSAVTVRLQVDSRTIADWILSRFRG
jgi:multidrug resistance efflux pump